MHLRDISSSIFEVQSWVCLSLIVHFYLVHVDVDLAMVLLEQREEDLDVTGVMREEFYRVL